MKLKIAVLGVAALMLSACLSEEDSNTSRFSLYVTDAPVDGAQEVVVQFSGVELHRAKGTETITFTAPKQIDLVYYSRGAAANLVDYVEIPAGNYEWVRLKVDAVAGVDDSYIVLADGTKLELQIPADAVDDLKLVSPFKLTADDAANYTIDFDLRKSIHQTVDGYMLRPALRLVEDELSGSIYGNVYAELLTGSTCDSGVSIYVYSGADVMPTDVRGTAGGPISSANIDLSTTVSFYWYTMAFLPAGTYTVALTCDGDLDQPDQVDTLTFLAQSNVEVLGGRNATYYDFTPE